MRADVGPSRPPAHAGVRHSGHKLIIQQSIVLMLLMRPPFFLIAHICWHEKCAVLCQPGNLLACRQASPGAMVAYARGWCLRCWRCWRISPPSDAPAAPSGIEGGHAVDLFVRHRPRHIAHLLLAVVLAPAVLEACSCCTRYGFGMPSSQGAPSFWSTPPWHDAGGDIAHRVAHAHQRRQGFVVGGGAVRAFGRLA